MTLGIFDSGNLLVHLAKIDINDIKNTKHYLNLLDGNLKELKNSLYENSVNNLTFVEGSDDGRMFTLQLPFTADVVWRIIGDTLYLANNKKYNIQLFNSNGDYLKEIVIERNPQKVTSADIENWIAGILDRYSNKPQFSISKIKNSLEKIKFPKYKPSFEKMLEYNDTLITLDYQGNNGFLGIIHNKDGNVRDQAYFEYNDFEFFNGKCYRITGGNNNPFSLTQYRINDVK